MFPYKEYDSDYEKILNRELEKKDSSTTVP